MPPPAVPPASVDLTVPSDLRAPTRQQASRAAALAHAALTCLHCLDLAAWQDYFADYLAPAVHLVDGLHAFAARKPTFPELQRVAVALATAAGALDAAVAPSVAPLPQRDASGTGFTYHGDERGRLWVLDRRPHKSLAVSIKLGQAARKLVFPLGSQARVGAVVYARLTNTRHNGVLADQPALTDWLDDCAGLLLLHPQGREVARAAFLNTARFPPVMTFLPSEFFFGSQFPPTAPTYIQLQTALGTMLDIVAFLFGEACELVGPLREVCTTTLPAYYAAAIPAAAIHSPTSAADGHALDRLVTPTLARLFDSAVANWFTHAYSVLAGPFLKTPPDHLGHIQMPAVAVKPFTEFFPVTPPTSFAFPSSVAPAASASSAATSARSSPGSSRPRRRGRGRRRPVPLRASASTAACATSTQT